MTPFSLNHRRRIGQISRTLLIVGLLAAASARTRGNDAGTQEFSTDPGWDGYRHQPAAARWPITRQAFGFSPTQYARGAALGEIGGRVQRSVTPASYGKVIAVKTLEDKLFASGRFAVRAAPGATGVLFGWFNESSRGWRTPNSLGFRIDGNGGNYWVFFEYGTKNLRTGGGETFEGRYQTTSTKPFPADGTSHEWSISYDPNGHAGNGEIVFTLDGTSYRARLAPDHKADGASFNRFGIWNQQSSGKALEIYFDDLVINGETEDFSKDPAWVGSGNHVEFEDREIRPIHDFGYSRTRHAGGAIGEVGGLIWRDEAPAFYAERVGPFTLDSELHASGRIAFNAAGSDSAIYLGWFDAESKKNKPGSDHEQPPRNLLAVLIEGPSRIGHYFRPAYRTRDGTGAIFDVGPVILPDGRPHRWTFDYFPNESDGRGRIVIHFDGEPHSFELAPDARKRGATFDRFGFFNMQVGGHYVRVYLDDLSYRYPRPVAPSERR